MGIHGLDLTWGLVIPWYGKIVSVDNYITKEPMRMHALVIE